MALIPPGLQTFTGANGVPVALGSVGFYVPGTLTAKDTWADTALTVTNPNPVPLDAAGRAAIWGSGSYRQIVKDVSGNVVWDKNVDTADAQLVASTGANIVGFTPAGGAGATTTVQTELRRILWLEQFFIASDPDYYNAFTRALTVLGNAGGGTLRIGQGTFNIASASLVTPLAVPSGVSIVGLGANATILQVTGSAVSTAVFSLTNQRDITLSDFRCIGNKQADGLANGSFVKGYLTNAASSNMRNLRFERLRLDDFGGPYWIELEANNTTSYRLSRIFVSDVEAYSSAGCIPVSGWASLVTYGMAVLRISASNSTSNLTHVRIRNFYADCSYIKQGIAINGNVQDVVLDTPAIDNAGVSAAADDSGSYAIMCYDSGSLGMSGITISDPKIANPRSCGIYVAAARDVAINNPQISGQTDQNAGSLPKGAIAINAPGDGFKILGGRLTGNWRDIHIIGGGAGFDEACFEAHGLTIRNTNAATSASIVIAGTGTGGAPAVVTGFRFHDCDIKVTGAGAAVCVSTIANQRIDGFAAYNCKIQGVTYGLNLWLGTYGGVGTEHASDDYHVVGCKIAATGANGIPINQLYQAGTLRVHNCKLTGVNASTIGALSLQGCLAIDVQNVVVTAADTAFRLVGCKGVTRGLRATGYSAALAYTGSLGLAAPTHTPKTADFVQNLAPAASGYEGWIYTAAGAWKGCGAIAA